MTGITPVENLQLISSLNILSWIHPLFSSENTPISYYIYIENQHGQLLYNDITNDTSYELYNLIVCDIYTATVIAHSGEYSSSNVSTQEEYNEGNIMLIIIYTNLLFLYIENNIIVLPDKVVFNEKNYFNAKFQVTVSKLQVL